MKEAEAQPLGNPIGTEILTTTVTEEGLKLDFSGTDWELLNIAATLVDHLSVKRQTAHEETLEAIIEILFQEEV
jgi:hypothetical protein